MGLFGLFSNKKKETLDKGLEKTKESVFGKLARAVAGKSTVDDDVLDDLEEVLITSDVGVETTVKIIRRIEERVARDKYVSTSELNRILREEIAILLSENHSDDLADWELPADHKPYVILVVGVNGVGKTTTIGKLAYQFKKAGKKVGMTLASGWYNASFFYGAGFTTALNDDGSTAMDWNGTSADGVTGVQVVQSMLGIAGNSAFLPIADGDISNQIASGDLCAVISGTWDAAAAQTAFGDGYAATKLPTYTCGDKQIQQGSVAGFKLVGVNKYSANAGWATLLADWITNEDNQAVRFAEREIGPSNINVAGSEEVSSNTAIAALSEQSAYGVVQIVGGKYWDPAKTFGEKVAQGQLKADDEAGIQAALDELVEGVSVPAE